MHMINDEIMYSEIIYNQMCIDLFCFVMFMMNQSIIITILVEIY